MGKTNTPKYVTKTVKGQNEYYYFRRKGVPLTRLPNPEKEPKKFQREYDAAVKVVPKFTNSKLPVVVEKNENGRRKRYVKGRQGRLMPIRADIPIDSPRFAREYRAVWKKNHHKDDGAEGNDVIDALWSALHRARKRAYKRKLGATDINIDYLLDLYRKQMGKCAVSGMKFVITSKSRHPSIDRIDNAKGYTKGNTRLVLWAVNVGLNDIGVEEYAAICAAVAEQNKT